MKPVLGEGCFADLTATPAAFTARVPEGIDIATAGVLGLAGTAAHDAVEAVEPQPGDTVLVSGAMRSPPTPSGSRLRAHNNVHLRM